MKIIPDSGQFILRPWHLRDYKSLAAHANNYQISAYLRDIFPFPYSENDAMNFISQVCDKEGLTNDFAIEVDGKAVGGIGFFLLSDIHRLNAEIGYWIGQSFQRRGIMGEALPLVCRYIFENYEITRIVAPVLEKNQASMQLLQKCGFVQEAVLKKNLIKNGEILDEHIFVLKKP